MMWKLYNYLFKWDYIQWRDSAASGVARVDVEFMGRAYYWKYKNIKSASVISKPEDVLWLTCNPSKYIRNPPKYIRPSMDCVPGNTK